MKEKVLYLIPVCIIGFITGTITVYMKDSYVIYYVTLGFVVGSFVENLYHTRKSECQKQ